MERKKIIINTPYVARSKSEMNEQGVKLCSDIICRNPNSGIDETRTLYYEFESEYEPFICQDRSDAFVSGLLITAMENDCDIVFDAPISARLFYQLTTYFIPMLSYYNSKKLSNINIIGPYNCFPIENARAVATGCSGGVDSFYTIARHTENCIIENYKLTHLVFASCGTLDNNPERIKSYYVRHLPEIKKIAKEINCKCIGCYTNLHEFYKFPYDGFCKFYATIYGSVPLALQKLVAIYYQSSGDPISEFNLDLSKTHGHDGQVFDVFSLSCLCTESLTFYSSGMEASRIEKEKYISSFNVAQRHLVVCGRESSGGLNSKFKNCSICPKCLRTMAQFYVLGELDKFRSVFDLDDFYSHKYRRIGRMMAMNKQSYVKDTIMVAKNNNIKIGLKSYLWCFFCFRPYKCLTKLFNNSMLVRKLYYRLNLDYKINGYRDAKYESYKEKI